MIKIFLKCNEIHLAKYETWVHWVCNNKYVAITKFPCSLWNKCKCCVSLIELCKSNSIVFGMVASGRDQTMPADSAYRTRPGSNCIDQSTEWSSCSDTCGPGKSTRVSNQNQACRLEMQMRLCMIRPCQPVLQRNPQVSLLLTVGCFGLTIQTIL